MPVEALISPPADSISSAMAWAERRLVPLKAMCSRKWAMPFSSGHSSREPALTQMPSATVSRCGMLCVTTCRPLSRREISTLMPHQLGPHALPDEGLDLFGIIGQDAHPLFSHHEGCK